MKSVILIVTFLFANLIFGQINHINDESGTFQIGNIDSPFLRVSNQSGNKIEGSIYLNDNWEQAIIIDEDLKKTTVLAKFNTYHSEIEIFKDNNSSSLLPVPGLNVTLNEKKFVPILLEGKKKNIFGEILVEGKNKLYKVYDVKINKAPSDARLLNIESTDRVVITSKLYYEKNGNINDFPISKKDINETIDSQIIKSAKTERLSLKKEEDIIKLFKLANSG
ncbi:hypothetical protein [Maribacter sp. 1_MG-2023]|uniref:hypothetical protein n=1 Tax=Maribacter sp. 1_MG-2023 TaxID=3062677 RepID=UPI0026E44A89|nr:hypothetical protein [Maribacter sp. 1_MG-2023]MDO6471219.1 hypothetical protein [Maribacter sp. 1_MG-2023]